MLAKLLTNNSLNYAGTLSARPTCDMHSTSLNLEFKSIFLWSLMRYVAIAIATARGWHSCTQIFVSQTKDERLNGYNKDPVKSYLFIINA